MAVVGLAALVGMVLLNELIFRAWLDIDYVRWYLDNGSVISIFFALVTLAWGDLNKQTYLISAHPVEYAAASLELLVLPGSALAASFEPGRERRRLSLELERAKAGLEWTLEEAIANPAVSEQARQRLAGVLRQSGSTESPEPEDEPTGLPLFDLLFAMLFAWAFVVALIAWLLVVVPAQYFVYLVTGAPAREACASPARAWHMREGKEHVVAEASKSAAIPGGAIESGFSARPVSFTAAITAAALFAASKLVS